MRTCTVVTCLMLALCAASALGQEVTGDLEGRILDPQSQPVEGATITVTGPSLQGERGTVTDPEGRFRVLALPPGSYTVNVARLGFRELIMEAVPVRLGRTISLGEILLEAAAVELEPLVVVVELFPHLHP